MRNGKKTALTIAAAAFAAVVGCSQSPVEKGATCLKLGDYERAQIFFNEALSDDPGNYAARLGLGKAFLQRAADNPGDTLSWRDACMHFEAARTLNPSGAALSPLLSQVWSERARQLLDKKDTISALEALTRAIGYTPRRAEPLNAAGIIYFRRGELDKAKALFSRAVSADSANTAVLFNLGMVAWGTGDFETAHGYWLRCLKLAPADETALYWFARAEKKKRETQSHSAPDAGRSP